MMDNITLGNFRCFRDKQTARLAPLTLLVGENSTGKTSFLALIRALWDVSYGQRIPDFKEEPYDLGSYREISYNENGTSSHADGYIAGFETRQHYNEPGPDKYPRYFETTFKKLGTRPIPVRRFYSHERESIEVIHNSDNSCVIHLITSRGRWKREISSGMQFMQAGGRFDFDDRLTPPFFYLHRHLQEEPHEDPYFIPLDDSPDLSEDDMKTIQRLMFSFDLPPWLRPVASAPVRSKPHRTYDPSRPTRDPEGDYIPMYLASLHSQDEPAWDELLRRLERFGRDAGLFDEVVVEQLGERDGGPFQIQIRRPGMNQTGPRHNLIDVGYGVSQILPLITEILREDDPDIFLLQQPEVHLHPSAQAALGSLFCQVASNRRQLIVETHSDYIVDRVRMDIRDSKSSLTPDDVSVLFFERNDMDVRIHSLRFDDEGNVLDCPSGYRTFFMNEARRSLGL